ncbi:hypothetical protein [Rhodococcus opacus]|uniref:hypothetical protein n=1 Tax=Rhodococcus opacus TaxID=37919 RepID=UPI00211DBAC6|nr:hypothetical protein [Rhodococcus opacus]
MEDTPGVQPLGANTGHRRFGAPTARDNRKRAGAHDGTQQSTGRAHHRSRTNPLLDPAPSRGARNDHPAPARPGSSTTTLLVDFAGLRPGSGLEHISWKQWFALFDAQALAFRFPGTEDGLAFELIPRTTGRPAGRHETTPRPAPE